MPWCLWQDVIANLSRYANMAAVVDQRKGNGSSESLVNSSIYKGLTYDLFVCKSGWVSLIQDMQMPNSQKITIDELFY